MSVLRVSKGAGHFETKADEIEPLKEQIAELVFKHISVCSLEKRFRGCKRIWRRFRGKGRNSCRC